jgi:hypothetical protein
MKAYTTFNALYFDEYIYEEWKNSKKCKNVI